MSSDVESPGVSEAVYLEVSALIRHYSKLRFTIMTVFFAVNGAAFAFLTQEGQVEHFFVRATIFAALGGCTVFGYLEFRLAAELNKLEAVAAPYERANRFDIFTRRLNTRIQTRWVVICLYVAAGLFWVWLYVFGEWKSLRSDDPAESKQTSVFESGTIEGKTG